MNICTNCEKKIFIEYAPVFGVFRNAKFYFCSIDCAHSSNIHMNFYIKKEYIKIKKDYPSLIFIDEDKNKKHLVKLNEKGKLTCLTIDSRINEIFKMLATNNNPLGNLVHHIFDDSLMIIKVYFNNELIRDIIMNGPLFNTIPRVELLKK